MNFNSKIKGSMAPLVLPAPKPDRFCIAVARWPTHLIFFFFKAEPLEQGRQGGLLPPSPILDDQLTLSQPGGRSRLCPPHHCYPPQGFVDLPMALEKAMWSTWSSLHTYTFLALLMCLLEFVMKPSTYTVTRRDGLISKGNCALGTCLWGRILGLGFLNMACYLLAILFCWCFQFNFHF